MELVGKTIGHIRIVDTLGRGGMGEVYLGFDQTLQREVALKAIRAEQRLDAEAKARFLREARVLSQLDHPGICRIYEYIEGEDNDFLVLERIQGRSLRAAIKEGLDPAQKHNVAWWVAEALVAAHAKGVAHRDLKPENVMLTDDGEVRILDFGLSYFADDQLAALTDEEMSGDGDLDDTVAGETAFGETAFGETAAGEAGDPGDDEPTAKAVAELAGAETGITRTVLAPSAAATFKSSSQNPGTFVQTEHGIVMGTVAYMSPEQARGERPTVAGDMYSFGLLLQELFTGRPPYEPGLKLMMLLLKAGEGETLPVTGVDPDLTTLINQLKSVAPEARPTAVETAERLRWIGDKPRRRLRRLAAAAVAVALVLAGLKYTFDLRRERSEAKSARDAAVKARVEEEEVSEFLLDLFAVSDPEQARGNTVTARELLDTGAERIKNELHDQPLSQARLMFVMGRVYRQLGLYEEALPLLEQALRIRRRELGDENLNTANNLDNLASLYHDLGRFEESEPLVRRALEIRERALGPDHPQVAASVNNLAFHYYDRERDDLAEPLFQRALELFEKAHGSVHEDVAKALSNLGNLYRTRGDYRSAEPYLRRAVEVQQELLGPDDLSLAASLNNLAILYYEQGDMKEAEPLYQRTLAIYEQVLGPEHPNVATILNNLAQLHRLTGEHDLARPLYVRALDILEKALGTDHPSYATSLNNLADLISAMGEDERAEPFYLRALEIHEKAFGPHHPGLADVLTGLANSYTRSGRYEEAEALLERSLAGTERSLAEQPENHSDRHRTAATLVVLGQLYEATGAGDRAREAWNRADGLMSPLAAGQDVASRLHTRVLALLHLGRVEEARPMAEKLLAKGWRRPEFLELCRRHGLLRAGGATG